MSKKTKNKNSSKLDKERARNEILEEVKKVKRKAKKKPIKAKEIKEVKKKKEKPKVNVQYRDEAKLDYQRSRFYEQQHIGYGESISYSGSKYESPYQSFLETKESSELTEEKLERIVKREQTDAMLGKFIDSSFRSIEEKENFKYWKECNKFMNMLKIQLAGVGESAGRGVFYI